MSKLLITVLAAVAALAALAVIAVGYVLFVDANALKPRFEAAASERIGLSVLVDGDMKLRLGPGLQLVLHDVTVRNADDDVASSRSALLGLRASPLLRGHVQVRDLVLREPQITVVRDLDGRFNIVPVDADRREGPPDLADIRVTVEDASFTYYDAASENAYAAHGVSLDIDPLQVHDRSVADHLLQRLTFNARVASGKLRAPDFEIDGFELAIDGDGGVFILELSRLDLFGGHGTGRARSDFSAEIPRHHVHVELEEFLIEKFLGAMDDEQTARGSLNFAADVSLQGDSIEALLESLGGEAWLRGVALIVEGTDLDAELSRYETLTGFNLVDVGAFFFAGPLGLIVKRGYEFRSLFQGGDDTTRIREVASHWDIERGVARARDVALATEQHRIAMKGSLDLVSGRYDDVTLAVIDDNGCVVMEQSVNGPFGDPDIDEPTLVGILVDVAFELLKEAYELLAGEDCDVFYDGSLQHPD
jgi:hypothetical protein